MRGHYKFTGQGTRNRTLAAWLGDDFIGKLVVSYRHEALLWRIADALNVVGFTDKTNSNGGGS